MFEHLLMSPLVLHWVPNVYYFVAFRCRIRSVFTGSSFCSTFPHLCWLFARVSICLGTLIWSPKVCSRAPMTLQCIANDSTEHYLRICEISATYSNTCECCGYVHETTIRSDVYRSLANVAAAKLRSDQQQLPRKQR